MARICGQLLVRDKADRTCIIDIAESEHPSTLCKIAGVDNDLDHGRYTYEIIIIANNEQTENYRVALAIPKGCSKVRPCVVGYREEPRDLQRFLTERFAYWAGYCDAKAKHASAA